MLIAGLIKKQQHRVDHNTEQWQQQQKLLQAETWLLKQRSKQFIGTVPGLTISFGLGVLMQMRHHTLVKTVRRTLGFSWLRYIL